MVARKASVRQVGAVWGCVGGLALASGCVRVNPQRDYDRAAGLIAEHTGVSAVYAPGQEGAADARTADLLVGGLTVEEAVQAALLGNPEFRARVAEIGASRADVAQSSLLSNPALSLGLQFPEGGGLTDVSVGFVQQIADLWQIPIRTNMAATELERTILGVGQAAVDLVAETRMRCYHVLAFQQALSSVEENLRLVRRSVELSETQLRAGEVSAFDVNLARAGVLDVQEELIATRGQLELARADLHQTLGLGARARDVGLSDALPGAAPSPLSAGVAASEPSSGVAISPVDPLPPDDALLDAALEQRFDIRLAWFGVRRAEAALRLEVRRFLPDVQAGFAFERGEQRALPDRKILADTARASIAAGQPAAPTIQSRGDRNIEKSQIIDAKLGPTLALALPIFDQNQAQIAKARFRVLQARQEYEARADAIAADVQRAAAAVRTAGEMIRFHQSEGIPQAETTVEGAQRRYQAGEASLLVLIEAQDTLVKRRRSYVATLRDYAVALARLEAAVGGRALLEKACAAPAAAPVPPSSADFTATQPAVGEH